jgi:hypothetical protein
MFDGLFSLTIFADTVTVPIPSKLYSAARYPSDLYTFKIVRDAQRSGNDASKLHPLMVLISMSLERIVFYYYKRICAALGLEDSAADSGHLGGTEKNGPRC